MKYLNALNTIHGLGPQKMKILLDFFGESESVWNSSFEDLIKTGIGEAISNKIVFEREKISPDEEMEKL